MIQFAGRLHNTASSQGVLSGGNRSQPPKPQSFAAELSGELAASSKLAPQAGGPPMGTPPSQQSVTWRDPGGAASTSQPAGLSGLVVTYPSAASVPAAGTQTAAQSQAAFDDAYWAKQPAAVQQLRNIQDPAEKQQVATQLAQQGYSIDVPIMVWGWDPQIATQLRQSQGYTWVPSALQQPVEVAPGLTVAGMASYDPAHPPAGSIQV